MLYQILAMAKNRVIGKNNKLPWHFSSDFKHFKETTIGQTVLMGWNTWLSLPSRPLPNRENFILNWTTEGLKDEPHVRFFDNLEKALAEVRTKHCFIIGGASLYAQTLARVDGIYLTVIDKDYDGDAYYPEIPPMFEAKTRRVIQENPKLEVIFYERGK